MLTVTLIGPDGVGKTTIARQLEASFPLPLKYVYMGENPESSNYMLPTTRWWANRRRKRRLSKKPTDGATLEPQSKRRSGLLGSLRTGLGPVRKGLGFVNRVFEEWYRQLIAYNYSRRGYIVVYDRHFLCDYFHGHIQEQESDRSVKQRMHGFMLKHTLPEPDLVICLDVPGYVAFERKGEFTPEFLEKRRNEYLSLKSVFRNFAVVNANRQLELVVQEVEGLIHQGYQNRAQKPA